MEESVNKRPMEIKQDVIRAGSTTRVCIDSQTKESLCLYSLTPLFVIRPANTPQQHVRLSS